VSSASSGKWQELVAATGKRDGLLTRSSGVWTANKLYLWHQYVGITTKAMAGKPGWDAGLFYVDLFAGTGICEDRDTGEWFPGSPLIAANAPRPFTKILLVEKDPNCAAALRARMDRSPAASRYRIFEGDCNQCVKDVVSEIPERALTVAVIDPPGLDVHFDTISTLAQGRRVDLLVLFADAMDGLRNLESYRSAGSRMDLVMGPSSEWREAVDALPFPSPATTRDALCGVYERQLARRLGYEFISHQAVHGPNGPLYRLVYASKDARGLDFWVKVNKRDRSGQTRFF